MGQLILCRVKRAKNPYYIESLEANIYSLEELLYVLFYANFADGSDFMNEDFIEWVRVELDSVSIAASLNGILNSNNKSLKEFFAPIEENSSFLTSSELSILNVKLEKFDHMSDLETGKMSADNYLKMGKISKAINAYLNLLSDESLLKTQGHVAGDVWNNLANAYAKLGDYKEACDCYIRAFRLNHRSESMTQAVMCAVISEDESIYNRIIVRFKNSEDVIVREKERLEKLYEEARIKAGYNEIPESLLDKWAKEYKTMTED